MPHQTDVPSQTGDIYQAPLDPASTLLVVLGAWEFPGTKGQVEPQPALKEAATSLVDFLTSSTWFGIPKKNVLSLFNSDGGPPQLREQARRFVEQRCADLHAEGKRVVNLIVYYAGHGKVNQAGDYRLAVRATNVDDLDYTTLTASSLGVQAETPCPLRRFVVVESCFAARAFGDLTRQAPDLDVVLLCAAEHGSTARVTDGKCDFTSALLGVLQEGEETPLENISVLDVHRLLCERISGGEYDRATKPILHCSKGAGHALLSAPLVHNVGQIGPTGGGLYQAYLEISYGWKKTRYCTEADRKQAEEVVRIAGFVPEAARHQRLSLRRIAELLSSRDYQYIVDFGSGYPSHDHLHRFASKSVIVYSDNDRRTCREGLKMVKDLRAKGHDVHFFDADATRPETLLKKLDRDGIIPRDEKVAFVYWGLSSFLPDDGIKHAMRQLYDWAAEGSMLVFQAQAHSVDPNNALWEALEGLYRKAGTPLHLRSIDEYCELLEPWQVRPADFQSVLELLNLNRRQLSIPMQAFFKGGSVGSGVFVEKTGA